MGNLEIPYTVNGGFNGKIMDQWGILFHCHV